MYLIDTNVWLERLLNQERSEEVGRFLDQVPTDRLTITDFAFHSVGVILSKLNKTEALLRFVEDIFVDGLVVLIRIEPEETQRLLDVMRRFQLDFDDAYQYVAAEKYNLVIVSFDADFDRTERKRKTPADVPAEGE